MVLEARGITYSVSRDSNCHDDAVMEIFDSTAKSGRRQRVETRGDARLELFDWIAVF